MNEKLEHLIERAGQLIDRSEAVLPKPLAAPDWSQAVAWRYRKRAGGMGALLKSYPHDDAADRGAGMR